MDIWRHFTGHTGSNLTNVKISSKVVWTNKLKFSANIFAMNGQMQSCPTCFSVVRTPFSVRFFASLSRTFFSWNLAVNFFIRFPNQYLLQTAVFKNEQKVFSPHFITNSFWETCQTKSYTWTLCILVTYIHDWTWLILAQNINMGCDFDTLSGKSKSIKAWPND